MRHQKLAAVTAALFIAAFATFAKAQDYPAKPITLVVPYPAGATTDTLGRALAEQLTKKLKVPVLVSNLGGADGVIGASHVARAAPDGYTLLVVDAGPISYTPLVNDRVPYDPAVDFTYLSMVMYAPLLIAAHPDAPFNNVKEFVASAKSMPGKYRMGSGNLMLQMPAELFKVRAGINIQPIPYKGGAPALQDAMGGHIELVSGGIGTLAPVVAGGRLKAIAVTGAKRVALLPDVPTIIESGYPDFVAGTWLGVLGPRGLSPAISRILSEAIAEAARSDQLAAVAQRGGAEQHILLRGDFAKYVAQEALRLGPVIKATAIKGKE